MLLACGLATLDVVQRVAAVPGANDKIVAQDLMVAAGGPAANAAVTAARLGVPARLLTRVGGAPLGRLVAADLATQGVEVTDLGGPDDAPALSTVLVTAGTGERAVVSVNATRSGGGAPEPETIGSALAGITAILVDGHYLDLAVPVAAAARARGLPVLLDGGSWKPGLEALLAHVDVAVLSADFAVPSSPEATAPAGPADPDAAPPPGSADLGPATPPPHPSVPATPSHPAAPSQPAAPSHPAPPPSGTLGEVAALGPAVVARSAGAGPIELLTEEGVVTVPVPAVDVVDTLGAGDVLHGALAAWWVRRPPDPTAALSFAARVASASCASAGARGWDPTPWRAELES